MSIILELIYYLVLFVFGISFVISLFIYAYEDEHLEEEYEHNNVVNTTMNS